MADEKRAVAETKGGEMPIAETVDETPAADARAMAIEGAGMVDEMATPEKAVMRDLIFQGVPVPRAAVPCRRPTGTPCRRRWTRQRR